MQRQQPLDIGCPFESLRRVTRRRRRLPARFLGAICDERSVYIAQWQKERESHVQSTQTRLYDMEGRVCDEEKQGMRRAYNEVVGPL